MSPHVLIHLGENLILGAVCVALFVTGHPIAGSVTLGGLIANTCFVTFRQRPPERAEP